MSNFQISGDQKTGHWKWGKNTASKGLRQQLQTCGCLWGRRGRRCLICFEQRYPSPQAPTNRWMRKQIILSVECYPALQEWGSDTCHHTVSLENMTLSEMNQIQKDCSL